MIEISHWLASCYDAAEELLCEIRGCIKGLRGFFCPRVHFTPIVRHDLAVAFSLLRIPARVLFKRLFHDHHYSTKEACYEPLREKIANNAMYNRYLDLMTRRLCDSSIILLHHESRLRTTSKGRLSFE